MKLSEIALKIDKSENNEDWVSIKKIGELFDLSIWNHKENERLKCFWIGNWRCTDTWVGYKMYFLDDEPVAYSTQSARKSDEHIMWFSKETSSKVKDYLISLMEYEDEYCQLDYCDINEDIGEGYTIHYNDNVTNWSYATLNSQPIKFIERIRETPDYGIDTQVKILYNEEEIVVDITDLKFKYRVIE